jgi:hypothetical protein
MGEHITVLSGRNGTMKTSLMGLLAHPFSSEAKDAFGSDLKTTLSGGVQAVARVLTRTTIATTWSCALGPTRSSVRPVSIYRVQENTNRHRVVVSGAEKGDGNFALQHFVPEPQETVPAVDTRAAPTTDGSFGISAAEAIDLKDFYENVFPSTEYEAFVPVHQKKVKTTFALAGASARYNWQSISSGEDNLGAIFNRLLGFQRSFVVGQVTGNGILVHRRIREQLAPGGAAALTGLPIPLERSF